MTDANTNKLGKVPELTLLFWIIKIAATTLGETAGDAVTMSMHLGYLIGTIIFAAFFLVAVAAQIITPRFHPALFWTVIVATTTFGTTLADYVDRSLGIGYAGGAAALGLLLLASLAACYLSLGTVAVNRLGATVGDFLDKPLVNGGLALSRYNATACLAVFIVACIVLVPQTAETVSVDRT